MSTTAFCIAITSLFDAGTCASGNSAFEIARTCPDGAGTQSLMLTLSILGVILSGATFAIRGRSPGGDEADTRSFLLGWSIFFTVAGTVMLIHIVSSASLTADAELGGTIASVLFLLLGVPTLLFSGWRASRA